MADRTNTAIDYFNRVETVASRTRLATLQSPNSPGPQTPTTPLTPRPGLFSRSFSSAFGSPGTTFRTDDDVFVFEFGARYLRAGLGGEARPRSLQDFSPRSASRAGDYSQRLFGGTGLSTNTRKTTDYARWGSQHELWSMNARDVELGLLSDKVERAVRNAIVDDILVLDESKKRSWAVAVPSALPHPLLSTLLRTLFNHYPPPSTITLLPTPAMCAMSAGLRSALVVDIGWHETVVTVLYEYREIKCARTSRAMKMVTWETKNMLVKHMEQQGLSSQSGGNAKLENANEPDFEEVENILKRMIWCRDVNYPYDPNSEARNVDAQLVQIPLTCIEGQDVLSVPFSDFAGPIDEALFTPELDAAYHDDDELPIPLLVYHVLSSLTTDVRAMCLPRVIITGGGANVPGLKVRVIKEINEFISLNSWRLIHNYGKTTIPEPPEMWDPPPVYDPFEANKDANPASDVPAHLQPSIPDSSIPQLKGRTAFNSVQASSTTLNKIITEVGQVGFISTVSSLGPWPGASLVTGLRIRGLVEIDREKFLQHGLTGIDESKRHSDTHQQQQQQQQLKRHSLIGLPGRAGEKDGGNWSLGVWA